MSNQTILWGTLLLPWVTLLFMPKDDVKRYLPAGLLCVFLSIIFQEAGVTHGWWYFREYTYPFVMLPTYNYGLFPVIPIWILKYTYGHWKRYIAIGAINNTIFSFFIFPWFGSRGIIDFNASAIVFILASILAIIIYRYQTWQESIFSRNEKINHSMNLQPAVAKPLPQKNEQKSPQDKE